MSRYYGAEHGQGETDRFIEKFFEEGYIGNCIEVGAADGIMGSNTKHFEELGWNCLCIEANPENYEKCKLVRKNTVWNAVSNISGVDLEFQVCTLHDGNQTAISGLNVDQRLVESHKQYNPKFHTVKVPCKTLDLIIKENNFEVELDIVSIDTEGTELDVLKGFDINKYSPKLLVIENNFDEPEVVDYLVNIGYFRVLRYGVNDFYTKEIPYE